MGFMHETEPQLPYEVAVYCTAQDVGKSCKATGCTCMPTNSTQVAKQYTGLAAAADAAGLLLQLVLASPAAADIRQQ